MKKKSRAPVYQIMFALAIFDILSLLVNSVGTGIFDILGISFCHYPLIIFCLGATAGGSWMAGCLACVMLAIERCVEINPKFPLEILFLKRVFPIVRIVMIGYTLYVMLFVKGLTFSLDFSCWFFDPLIGKDVNFQQKHTDIFNYFSASSISQLPSYL